MRVAIPLRMIGWKLIIKNNIICITSRNKVVAKVIFFGSVCQEFCSQGLGWGGGGCLLLVWGVSTPTAKSVPISNKNDSEQC